MRWQSGSLVATLGMVGVAGWAFGLMWSMAYASPDLWSALVIGPVVLLASAPLITRAARADGGASIRTLLWVALVLKLGFSCLRYAVAFLVYDGSTDSLGYHKAGAAFAAALWQGHLVIPKDFIGTEAIGVITGLVYSITGPTLLGGYLVFAWMAFWGQWMLYRAAVVGLPGMTHQRRYALAVLLLPSLLYWPASVGKESVMLLGIGLGSVGFARLSSHRPGGVLPLVTGLALTSIVRPHIAVMLGAAMFVGWVVRRPAKHTPTSPIVHVAGIVAAGAVVFVLALRAAAFLGVENPSLEGVQATLEDTAARTATGGSEFVAHPVQTPLDLPEAALSVLFRPWPWEASGMMAMLASAEGIAVLTLLVLCWSRLIRVPRLFVQEPYVAFTIVYILLFVYGFSSFGNFGLLVRERTQVLPFVLLLACLPAPRRRPRAALRARREVVRSP